MAVTILGSGSTPVTGTREFNPVPQGGGGGEAGISILSGDVNNYVITSTGTGDEIKGESNLTFNGTVLTVTGSIIINSGTLTVPAVASGVTATVLNYNTSNGLVTYNTSGGGTTNFLAANGTWIPPPGSITKAAVTPQATQVTLWAGDGILTRDSGLTYNGSSLTVSGDITTGGLFVVSTQNSQLINNGATYEISIGGSWSSTSSKIWATDGNVGLIGYNALSYSAASGSSEVSTTGDTVLLRAYTGATYKTIQLDANISIAGLSTYADNTAAKAGGLADNDIYRTATGVLMIVYT